MNLFNIFKVKPACKLWKNCPYYDCTSVTCVEDGGEDYCGRYKEVEETNNI